jgi:hypothetical protein
MVATKRQKNSVWKNVYYIRCYQLALQGMTKTQIAKALGIEFKTFNKWMQEKPTLRRALEMGRDGISSGQNSGQVNDAQDISDFENFVFQRLPDDLRELWTKIHRVQNEPNGIVAMEAMLESKGVYARMHLFIYALSVRNFNVSKACKAVNIPIGTYRFWLNNEPKFAELIDEMKTHKKSFFEDCLIKLAKKGDSPAIIFGNRTLNRDMGYADKKELEITGSINHSHSMVAIEDLDLDIDTLKIVLEAVRKMREAQKPATISYNTVQGTAVPVREEDMQEMMKETIGKEEDEYAPLD